MNFKSLRTKLLAKYLVFSLLLAIMGAVMWYFINKNHNLSGIINTLNHITINSQKSIAVGQEFLRYDAMSIDFHRNGSTPFYQEHEELLEQIKDDLIAINNMAKVESFEFYHEYMALRESLNKYENHYDTLIDLLLLRGVEDFGIHGELRVVANKMAILPLIRNEDIYTLMDYESGLSQDDDSTYFYLTNKKLRDIKERVSLSSLPETEKSVYYEALDEYQSLFDFIVETDQQIGLANDQGYNNDLKNSIDEIDEYLQLLTQQAENLRVRNFEVLNMTVTRVIFFAVILALILSFTISADITKPIAKLAIMIDVIVLRKFDGNTPLMEEEADDEVGKLTKHVNMMVSNIHEYLEEIKSQSKQLETQNKKLMDYNSKIKDSEEKLKEMDTIKNKFFSIIAHDLKGPFNTMRGFLNIFLKYGESLSKEEILKMAHDLDHSFSNVYNLTNNLLQWAITQTRGVTVDKTEFDILEATNRTVAVLKDKAAEKGIDLRNQITKGKIDSDPNIFDFIIRNLTSNALKFTEKGGHILLKSEENLDSITIKVIDSGVGIDPKRLNKLFDIGTKTSTKGTDNENGTGLGLVLCKEFTAQLGGEIHVDSEPGIGTTFSVVLPR